MLDVTPLVNTSMDKKLREPLFVHVLITFLRPSTITMILYLLFLQERLKNKREKLAEQLGEAKCLQRALERRGGVVTGTLLHYFTQPELEQFNTFMRTKTLLLLQAKMLAERLSFAQQQLDAVSLYKF